MGILANRLGGCGTCPINIFPQNAGVNRGIYRVMEGQIYDCILNGAGKARLEWVFNHKNPATKHLRADSYTYTASFTGGNCDDMSQTFSNIQWKPGFGPPDYGPRGSSTRQESEWRPEPPSPNA